MRRKGRGCHRSSRFSVAALLMALACFTPLARAQDQPSGGDPKPQPVLPETPKAGAMPHRFWDRTNVLLFSGVAVFRGLDYASTRNFMARGRQEILIPDDVVNNSAGFAGLEAAATATSIGLSYWMHRTGHHKLERWISITHMSVTAFGDVRNYSLESKHR
jgi:hypothetical protein